MGDYQEQKAAELRFMAEEYKKNPDLFSIDPFLESPKYLRKFGISIPHQDTFPHVFLKLWPQDFIVEEIGQDGQVRTINTVSSNPQLEEEGQTIFGTLLKCGLQTSQAIDEVAKQFVIEPHQIQYAGLKDKDAITAQEISFHKVPRNTVHNLELPQVVLKDIRKGKGGMAVGSLKGNRFTIIARTTSAVHEQSFLENLERIQREGIYNFFYLQRFGSPRFMNFKWAAQILAGRHEEAVLSFLETGTERELPYFRNIRREIQQARENWKKIEELLSPFPLSFGEELKVVRYLKNHPKDFRGSFAEIPEQITIWVSALSSWLFNQKLSEYLEQKIPLPAQLPLFLNNDREDWQPYKKWLEEEGIFPPRFENLRPCHILLRKRSVPTKMMVEIHHAKVIPQGVALSFSLHKGVYATTFFAHLFQLIADRPPSEISEDPLYSKKILGEESFDQTFEYFKPFLQPKTKNMFEGLKES